MEISTVKDLLARETKGPAQRFVESKLLAIEKKIYEGSISYKIYTNYKKAEVVRSTRKYIALILLIAVEIDSSKNNEATFNATAFLKEIRKNKIPELSDINKAPQITKIINFIEENIKMIFDDKINVSRPKKRSRKQNGYVYTISFDSQSDKKREIEKEEIIKIWEQISDPISRTEGLDSRAVYQIKQAHKDEYEALKDKRFLILADNSVNYQTYRSMKLTEDEIIGFIDEGTSIKTKKKVEFIKIKKEHIEKATATFDSPDLNFKNINEDEIKGKYEEIINAIKNKKRKKRNLVVDDNLIILVLYLLETGIAFSLETISDKLKLSQSSKGVNSMLQQIIHVIKERKYEIQIGKNDKGHIAYKIIPRTIPDKSS